MPTGYLLGREKNNNSGLSSSRPQRKFHLFQRLIMSVQVAALSLLLQAAKIISTAAFESIISTFF
ncbi:hypothetical protein TYRP_006434 [Tyrophagus putrescentiae]|nr:hypothetical protein TYRP_006434 [Tyrophagus putrescentiae]